MARPGRPAKPIELHKRQGTYRPDRHGPKPMLASPSLVRPPLVYTVPFDDHQYVCPDCAAPVDLDGLTVPAIHRVFSRREAWPNARGFADGLEVVGEDLVSPGGGIQTPQDAERVPAHGNADQGQCPDQKDMPRADDSEDGDGTAHRGKVISKGKNASFVHIDETSLGRI
jgi:hypothetical protein